MKLEEKTLEGFERNNKKKMKNGDFVGIVTNEYNPSCTAECDKMLKITRPD